MTTASKPTATNDDILDTLQGLMKVTPDGFGRTDNRIDKKTQGYDICGVVNRIVELKHKAKLNEQERLEAKEKLDALITWAKKAGKQLGVPLNL